MVATVSAVSSASGATRYYERDGYYANDDPEHKKGSFWHGKAAEELGLSKQVDPAAFHHVLEGHVPDSDIRLGRVRDGEHQHRPGFDLIGSENMRYASRIALCLWLVCCGIG